MKGKVYLVGAGPGHPGLITVRGREILRQAEVVVYDYLVDKRILSQAKPGAQLVCCGKPGTCTQRPGKSHNGIDGLVAKKAKQGKKVVRLKGGDPAVFGRFRQELNKLVKQGIEYEVVPGVSAAAAAASFTGIPLTDRRFASSCVLVTGQEDPYKHDSLIDWPGIVKSGTIILYMAVGNLKQIVKAILKAGKNQDTPVAVIQDVSLPTQKIIRARLKNIIKQAKQQKLKPPAIIIIGEVAKLEKEFNWLRQNKRILFTGLSEERYFIKGTYFHLPLIKIEPMKSYREFDDYLRNIKTFHWIVFASRYGVEYFFKRLAALGLDSRVLECVKIAAIGNSTAKRLLDFAILADLIPKHESSTGLVQEFKKRDLKDKTIFMPRSNLSDKGLTQALQNLGAKVTTAFAYRNVMPSDLPDIELGFFDQIMFTSPSTVRNFKKRYNKLPKSVKVRCIGNLTAQEAKRCKLLE